MSSMNGIVSMGSPIVHLARGFRTTWCGVGNVNRGDSGNTLPVGAVNADDPHLCPECETLATPPLPSDGGGESGSVVMLNGTHLFGADDGMGIRCGCGWVTRGHGSMTGAVDATRAHRDTGECDWTAP